MTNSEPNYFDITYSDLSYFDLSCLDLTYSVQHILILPILI